MVEDNQAPDYALWVAWSNEHANPASGFRELEESQRKTVLQQRLAEVPGLEDEFGIGTEECSRRGCEGRALKGMDQCAWHAAGGDS